MPPGPPPGVSPSPPLDRLIAQVNGLIAEGRFSEAIAPLSEAAALYPDKANIQTDLGGLYLESNRPAEAVGHLRRAIAINPRIGIAHWRLGVALQALDDADGAIESLERATQIRPDLADAHYRLGVLYEEQSRLRDALDAFRRAAETTDDPAVKALLDARALMAEGRDRDAEPFLRSALSLDPEIATASVLLGRILAASGRFDEAAKYFEAELAHAPQAGLGYYDLVRCRKITEADKPLLERMDAALQDKSIGDHSRSIILLARGKALDDLGRYEEAMKSLDAASGLRSKAFRFDIAAFERQVDAIIALFSAEVMASHVSANGNTKPVLIVGMPRSGTTLTEQIVSSHPDVAGAGEVAFWRRLVMALLDTGSAALTQDFLAGAASEYLDGLSAIAPGASRVSDKNPFNFMAVGLIHLAFPRAAIIHCRRNPIDTAISIHQTHFARSAGIPTGGEELVRYFRGYQRLMAHWRRVLPEGRMHELDYERLTAWPASEIRKLIDYTGLPWNEACLTPHVNMSLVRTPSGWQVRQSINTSSVDRWRRYEPWLGPLAALVEQPAPAAS